MVAAGVECPRIKKEAQWIDEMHSMRRCLDINTIGGSFKLLSIDATIPVTTHSA
jgi:hypothetical protein